MKWGSLSSLRTRLLLFVALVMLPVFGFIFHHFTEMRRDALAEAEQVALREAGLVALEEKRMIEETRQLLVAFSLMREIREMDPEACHRFFVRLSHDFPGYSNLGVADADGNVLCSLLPLPRPTNIADRDYFRSAVENRDFSVGGYQVGRITGRPGFDMACPIVGSGGRVKGVVYAAVDLRPLGRSEGEVSSRLERMAILTKLDGRGMILARKPGDGSLVGKEFPDLLRVRPLLEKGRGVVLGGTGGGKRYMHAVARVPTARKEGSIYVVLSIPEDTVFTEANGLFARNMMALAVVALIALGAAWFGGGLFILRPVRGILDATRRVAAGDLGTRRGPPYEKGELGELARGFDEMVGALQAKQAARERAEEALRRSEEDYRSIVRNAPLGILRSTMEGRFLMVNPALVEMLGYSSAEELLNADLERDIYVRPEDRQRVIERFNDQDPVVGVETDWKRKDGRPLHVRASGRLVRNDDGSPAYYEVFVEDETRKRMIERQFLHAQRMEVVGRLAGGIAHDFNNLLGVIGGYCELLLGRLGPDSPLREWLNEVHKATDRAVSLTRQLLAFSRKQLLDPKVLDLNAVVGGMKKMLQRLIGENIELRVGLAENLWPVRIDPGQLEQIVMNLAVNSRDAMPAGGALVVETANAVIPEPHVHEGGEMPAGSYVLLSVSDTGSGMDAETRARIFEPFFTTKESGKGTGLGLATVYGIVKQSKGYIWVYSEPGKGTTFRIYLPRADEPAERTAPVRIAAARGGSETVLAVEDDAALRKLVREILDSAGYTVLEARDPAEALDIASGHPGPIHLLLADVVLPGMNGRELAGRLRSVRPGLRVLYMSGYTADVLGVHGVLEEGTFFLSKPFTRDMLLEKARRVLDAEAG
ncbi:MAG: ATP-binding protein [Deltaproteobacteria bacterium]|nr:ATP-binding protein [Deltaproteobacteria bacterium]